MTMVEVKAAMDLLRGAVMIVYPMGLPPHDPIKMEFEDKEELEGTQVGLDYHHTWTIISPRLSSYLDYPILAVLIIKY